MIQYGYMCKIDFDIELPEYSKGVKIYPTLEAIKKYRNCVNSGCGVVRIKIELDKVVQEESFNG